VGYFNFLHVLKMIWAAKCDLIIFLIFESQTFVFDNEFLRLSISKEIVYSIKYYLIMLLFANNSY